MSDVLLVAILIAFFVFAIGFVRSIGRMIEGDTDPDDLADEPDIADSGYDSGYGNPGNSGNSGLRGLGANGPNEAGGANGASGGTGGNAL
jgi:hypothetical protein